MIDLPSLIAFTRAAIAECWLIADHLVQRADQRWVRR